MARAKFLSKSDIAAINQRIRDGSPKARHELLMAYQPLFRSQAAAYLRLNKMDMSLIGDVVQTFNETALKVIERYEPDRASFPVFFKWYFKSSFQNFGAEAKFALHIPVKLFRQSQKIHAIARKLETEGKEVSVASIVEEFGDVEVAIVHIKTVLAGFDFVQGSCSIYDPAGKGADGDDILLIDKLFPEDISSFDILSQKQGRNLLSEAIACLEKRDQEIVKRRLIDGQTQREVGRLLGISHQRVEQREVVILQNLKTFFRRKKIRSYEMA